MTDHRFRNLLIRDVIYDGLLKRSRAALHEEFAAWLPAAPAAGRLIEFEEIIGYHLKRAYLLGCEVSAIGDAGAEVGERASGHLGAAFARSDMPAAANLLQRVPRSAFPAGRQPRRRTRAAP